MRTSVRVAAVLVFAAVAGSARASQLIDRNAHGARLLVNTKGEALISYRTAGGAKHVLAWGAVNAIAPSRGRSQVVFRLDYSGGWGRYRRDYWRTFRNACRPYDGPPLAWLVTACTAPDGSYWALQAWQRELPDYGIKPTPSQAVWELRLSHWSGALPALAISTDWAWHRWDHLYGTFSYGGSPVFGFRADSGNPLDSFGRNVYLDTYDSVYGKGWHRENSFLTHTGTGAFCYSVNPHGPHPAGRGTRYRATVEGPGVTPDVMWDGPAPGPYNPALDLVANEHISALGDRLCRAN